MVESERERGPHRPRPHPVGFGIADKLRLAQIELEVSLQLPADVGSQADAHRPIHDVRVRHGEPARPDAVEEIPHVVERPLRPAHVIRQHFRVLAQQSRSYNCHCSWDVSFSPASASRLLWGWRFHRFHCHRTRCSGPAPPLARPFHAPGPAGPPRFQSQYTGTPATTIKSPGQVLARVFSATSKTPTISDAATM